MIMFGWIWHWCRDGCAGHDARDFAFAKHFDLPIIPVVKPIDVEYPKTLRAGKCD